MKSKPEPEPEPLYHVVQKIIVMKNPNPTTPQACLANHPRHTGFLTHKVGLSISAECTLIPWSVQKMNALIVISATQKCGDARGPKM